MNGNGVLGKSGKEINVLKEERRKERYEERRHERSNFPSICERTLITKVHN
jgi:hypothetical protein